MDLRIPGPMVAWEHSRTYDSASDTLDSPTQQGNGWYGSPSDMRLASLAAGHARISLVQAATSQTIFELSGSIYQPPVSTELTLTHDAALKEYRVEDKRTGQVWLFHDFTVVWSTGAPYLPGRLKEATTRYWKGKGKVGSIYSYHSSGRINQITTPQGQEYNIVFSYTANDLISQVEVKQGSLVIAKVEYTYFNGAAHSSDIGSAGDLVQVKVSQRASNNVDWIERYTQYRYDQNSRLKGIYRHDGIFSLLADNDLNTPEQVLAQADTYSTGSPGGHKISDFASRLYTYYTSILATSNVAPTAFAASENLESTYGGANTDETGMVKVGIDRPDGCSSCGGSGGSATGISYEYYYMSINHGSTPNWNDVVWLAIEDIKDSSGAAVKRTVWGFNDTGRVLREAQILDPVSAPQYWCMSQKFDLSHEGRLAEERQASAHTEVDTAGELRNFLDPSTGSNDTNTVNNSAGVVHVYEYDTSHRRTGAKIKNGENGTAYYVMHTLFDSAAAFGQPEKFWNYATQVATSPQSSGFFTEYNYTFWDGGGTRMKTRQIISPVIGTSQNGSDVASSYWEYYDEMGRLRWSKNGEGYVTYYSYNPSTGGLAYEMVDVNTASLPGEITDGDNPSGTDVLWEAWTETLPAELERDSGLPTALALVNKTEYDSQGRPTRTVEPGGANHYTVYEDDRTIQFPYWDATAGRSLRPIRVSKTNAVGQVGESYEVRASFTSISHPSGPPTGFSAEPGQGDYVAWIRFGYDPLTGELNQTDQYFDIPASTAGSLGTNFYSTHVLYDAMGRFGASVQFVATGKYQVWVQVYDRLGRVVESRRGVSTTSPTSYATLAGSSPPSWLATTARAEYDGGLIGDGHVTSSKGYYGTGTNDFIEAIFKRTYRGHLRGVDRKNGTTSFGPYQVQDIDWMGRVVASATYASAPAWPTDYANFVHNPSANSGAGGPTGSGYNDTTLTKYDDLGRVYRTLRFPGTQSANRLEENNYYDRNGQLTATGDKHGAHTEYAYDGAGRQYQERTVMDVAATKYSSGAFQYRAPAPRPEIDDMSTTGNDGLIEFSHTVYIDDNVTQEHSFEINHDDTNGIDIDATDSYVRATTYLWYDAADQLKATADYGSGDTTAGAGAWKYVSIPARPGTALDWTDSAVYDGLALLTRYTYDSAGRQESMKSGVRKNSTNTDTTTTKTFYDALSRRTFVAENFGDFDPATLSTIGDGSDPSKDRVTKWQYNGLGQVAKLTAYNGSSSSAQETEYLYADGFDASLVTLTKYPDGNTNTAGTQDNVQMTYNLDGSLATRKDQRGVVLTYTYDTARRLSREGATPLPGGVDGTVKSIARTYDSLGRPEKITSYPNADGSGTAVNEAQYEYTTTTNRLYQIHQAHGGAVVINTSPKVRFVYDTTVSSGVYTDGLRVDSVQYPVVANAELNNYFGGDNSITDVLGRAVYQKLIDGDLGTADQTSRYEYNGINRLVRVYTDAGDTNVGRKMYSSSGNYDSFDRFGRPVTYAWKSGSGAVLDQTDYTYDYAGNRLTRDIPSSLYATDNQDQVYGYDGLHRLKTFDEGTKSGGSISGTPTHQQDWTLDQLGNWAGFVVKAGVSTTLDQTRYHNAVNEIDGNGGNSITATTGANWIDPLYDDTGNMTEAPSPADPTVKQKYVYDAWNRLVMVTDASDDPIQTNEYDGLGQRIVRVDAVHSDTFDYYYNDEWQLLTEVKNGTTKSIYHWHPFYIDALAVRMRAGETYFFLQDANFNVTAAVDDSDNAVKERYAYSPYGEVTVLNPDFSVDSDGTDIGNTHLYTGRERDPETGLQLNRNRFYAGHLGRWLTRDPIGYRGGANLYGYVIARPTYYVDPSGLGTIHYPPEGLPDPPTKPWPVPRFPEDYRPDPPNPFAGPIHGMQPAYPEMGAAAMAARGPLGICKLVWRAGKWVIDCVPSGKSSKPPSTDRKCRFEELGDKGPIGGGKPGSTIPEPLPGGPIKPDPWVQVGRPNPGPR